MIMSQPLTARLVGRAPLLHSFLDPLFDLDKTPSAYPRSLPNPDPLPVALLQHLRLGYLGVIGGASTSQVPGRGEP